jgi:hypothetical protein
MIPVIQTNFFLNKTEAVKNRVGSKWKRERDIDREKLIKDLIDRT